MNFQEKLMEASAELRARAATVAASAIDNARTQAALAAKRAVRLKASLAVLNGAGRELNLVARRNGARFVKQNSSIAADLRKDLTTLAKSTYASLTRRAAPKKARRAPAARRRAARAA